MIVFQSDHIVGLVVDVRDHLIFWSDVSQERRGIYRARLTGGGEVEEVEHIVSAGENILLSYAL